MTEIGKMAYNQCGDGGVQVDGAAVKQRPVEKGKMGMS